MRAKQSQQMVQGGPSYIYTYIYIFIIIIIIIIIINIYIYTYICRKDLLVPFVVTALLSLQFTEGTIQLAKLIVLSKIYMYIGIYECMCTCAFMSIHICIPKYIDKFVCVYI